MHLRIATPEDAPKLLEIYRPYVEHTVITFEYEVPSVEEFANRICHTLKQYPYLVAEEGESLLGYAYASPFKSRAAYQWSVETSIYVRQDMRHEGVGTILYQELERFLARQNVCNVCACIAYPNPPSVAFHERLGYTTVAHFHHSGYKAGKWWDMIWMEKELVPHSIPPKTFVPFPDVQR
ncbi:MAG: N-acetyltransferase [Lachnospiraceae bacterium]|nr:N-acetyltransferase [Lachnospiraceae bacterium]